jgi:molybdopterin-containing oxidoreductase family iron-sulfur binding subunit
VTQLGQIRSWSAFQSELRAAIDAQRARRGAGLRFLTETVTSPTLHRQLLGILDEFPLARWHQYEPVNRDMVLAGARLALGEYANTVYQFDRADVILSLDADFLTIGPGHVRYARDFAARRRLRSSQEPDSPNSMNRLYVAECMPTCTGAKADHRWPIRPREVETFARAVASGLGIATGESPERVTAVPHTSIAALARDFQQHRGRTIVIAGEHQLPVVHALAHAMNFALGNVNETVFYTDPVEADPVDETASLRDLVAAMDSGAVDLLVIIGGNPAFTAPADLHFTERLAAVKLRAHLSLYDDETSAVCHWHVPEAHFLETWSDARAYDGTASIIQPLIAPLYGGHSAHELLAAFSDSPDRSGYEIVREYWRDRVQGSGISSEESETSIAAFARFWRKTIHDGVVPGTALPGKNVALVRTEFALESSNLQPRTPARRDSETLNPLTLEISFRPDLALHDGRFANNGWLHELPRPLTKLTWDNAALVSPLTAGRLELSNGDVVELLHDGRTVSAPIWIAPGHGDDCVTVQLGYGRTRAGKIGTGVGFNAYAIRTSEAPWFSSGVVIRKTGMRYPLASTQQHHLIDGRDLIRSIPLAEVSTNVHMAGQVEHNTDPQPSLYPDHEYSGYKWGMAIDLNSCTGCGACVVACQAENNIPIVGKDQVLRGREMHWLRVDTYYKGDPAVPASLETCFQPVPCMHCENAPCEVVCPVAATVHSAEGLNDMVYNRCVGTRYCSNNCPYKVRRFNFLQYSDFVIPSLKLLHNPDVTVRSRGVMEKCTYCVQRINSARITAEKEDRRIRDGELMTACQQVCPARAIVFGDLNDPDSEVSRWKADPLNYSLLKELNTRPRTTYLAAVRNPNPDS